MSEGKGSVGALLQKDDMHEKLIETIDEMNAALKEVKRTTEAIRRKWGQ